MSRAQEATLTDLHEHRVYYWFGAHFSASLLIQALLMINVHLLLLHIALINRPTSPTTHAPFAHTTQPAGRPYDFWQWRDTKPYWMFITYFTLALLVLHFLLYKTGLFLPYTSLLGYIALAIEATLPIPQLLANYRKRGCKGFRLSVCVNWIIGDTFKMWFFFASGSGEGGVPLAFKIGGIFQALCDLGLGLQFYMWGDGPTVTHGHVPGNELGHGIGLGHELRDGFGREKAQLSPVVEAGEELKDRHHFGSPTGSDEKMYGVGERI